MEEQYNIDGAYFRSLWRCQHCGACCNAGGFLLQSHEVDRLAVLAGMSKSEFKRNYVQTKKIDGIWFSYCKQPCPFYVKGEGCKIYAHRPAICRLFPFVGDELNDFCPSVVSLREKLLKKAREASGKSG